MYIQRRPSSARPINKPPPATRSGVAPTPIRRQGLAPGQTYIPPGTYRQGNTQLNVHYGSPPASTKVKKGRTIRDTEEPQTQQGSTNKRKLHPVLYLGIGMLGMLLLWVGL